jgi:tRNA(adenine34) deaminase
MQEALRQAELAQAMGEVPVGAVLVLNDQIIARAHNQNITLNDPSAHAEIMVLRAAGALLNNYRLLHTQLYVTLEPCLMCLGAIVHARVGRVVFGASDPKTGACGSCVSAHAFSHHNHRVEVEGGVLADTSALMLKTFFSARRR